MQGRHLDWNTLIYNYGRREVANFLLANALFWLDRYQIDGVANKVDETTHGLVSPRRDRPGSRLPTIGTVQRQARA